MLKVRTVLIASDSTKQDRTMLSRPAGFLQPATWPVRWTAALGSSRPQAAGGPSPAVAACSRGSQAARVTQQAAAPDAEDTPTAAHLLDPTLVCTLAKTPGQKACCPAQYIV